VDEVVPFSASTMLFTASVTNIGEELFSLKQTICVEEADYCQEDSGE
jgi:hypothetical protein